MHSSLPFLGLILAAAVAAPPPSAIDADVRLLGAAYPLEARPSFPAGLYHWIDSLAGTSVGKTNDAHREDFLERNGRPTTEDIRYLNAFRVARAEHMRTNPGRDGPFEIPRSSALLGVFCASISVEQALERASGQLSPEAFQDLRAAIEHFRPRYEEVWQDAEVARRFLGRVRSDPRRERLSELLNRMVRFYGAEIAPEFPPAIALIPVREGYGTHAEAVGRHLLLEIRPNDDLAGQASVIVHENGHFLWTILPEQKRDRLESVAREASPHGARAWRALREALPTALGQGVADREFRPDRWSRRAPWYHEPEIDAYAKALYGLVHHTLAKGKTLDEEFVRAAVSRFPTDMAPVRAPAPELTPRSP